MSCKEVFTWFALACCCSIFLVLFILASAAIITIPDRLKYIEKAIKELKKEKGEIKND